jgi:general secretion pathway protein C
MSARWITFLLWALVAASAVAWGLKLFVSAPPAPRDVRVADAAQALRGDPSRVLGVDAPPPQAAGDAPAPAADARFQLVGVVAPRSAQAAREGVALIAVDGKPAKAYRVGAKVDEDTVLKSVRARGADLGPREGKATIALEIVPPPPAATGVLPPAGGDQAGVAPPPGARKVVRPGVAPQPVMPSPVPVPPPTPLPNLQPQGAPGIPQSVAPPEGLPRS